jgi:hypothetical protein
MLDEVSDYVTSCDQYRAQILRDVRQTVRLYPRQVENIQQYLYSAFERYKMERRQAEATNTPTNMLQPLPEKEDIQTPIQQIVTARQATPSVPLLNLPVNTNPT